MWGAISSQAHAPTSSRRLECSVFPSLVPLLITRTRFPAGENYTQSLVHLEKLGKQAGKPFSSKMHICTRVRLPKCSGASASP
jgi:hypothetical protein